MKIDKLLLIVLAVLFVAVLGGCTNTQKEAAPYKDITVQEAKPMIDGDKDILILDVRTEAEFALGHLAGAVNIPHFDIEERYKELDVDKNKQIITICTMGGRSRLAADSLSKLGFTNIYNMVGGLNEWYKVHGESGYG